MEWSWIGFGDLTGLFGSDAAAASRNRSSFFLKAAFACFPEVPDSSDVIFLTVPNSSNLPGLLAS
jgi:hypothetical protein